MDEMKKPAGTESLTEAFAEEPKRTFAPIETAFAWLCFLAGYLFFRLLPLGEHRLGAFLFVVILFAGTAVLLRVRGIKAPILPLCIAAASCVLSASLIVCANRAVCTLAYWFAILSYLYFVSAACGRGISRGISGTLLADYLNAALVLPFCSFGSAIRAAFSGKAAKSGGKIALRILSGVCLALVPTVAVAILLSYDDGFTDLMHRIFSADVSIAAAFSHVNCALFGILLGMYLFGLYTASTDKEEHTRITADGLDKTARACRRLSAITVLCATVPILFLYAVFFVSQWQYYVSAFTGTLPENLSYAQYAREGFFQLCAVAVINLCMTAAASLLTRRKDEKPPVFLKVITVLYAAFTLVLIATAISKMVLYIDTYGLTQKRVYASVFMIAMAVVFAVILVKQFVPRTPSAIAILCVFALFAAVALGNADAQIARYNVDRYLDGTLAEVDIGALAELGDAAVPQLVRLAEIEAEKLGTDVKTMLERHHVSAMRNRLSAVLKTFAAGFSPEEEPFFGFNIPAHRARMALTDAGLIG